MYSVAYLLWSVNKMENFVIGKFLYFCEYIPKTNTTFPAFTGNILLQKGEGGGGFK
jgi:hypothetical protein